MDYRIVFVGGGLSNGLSALALLSRHPNASLAILERGERLGGNHTWCFHAGDLDAEAQRTFAPLVTQRWSGHTVRFPRRSRRLASAYCCVTSERLHDVLSDAIERAPNAQLLLGTDVAELAGTHVTLADGRRIEANLVIDGRGPSLPPRTNETGYQKFVGLEVEVEPTHELTEPVLMDACVRQHDGFRFLYVLPFEPTRVLLEDTYFSDSPELDELRIEARILAYARAQGLRVRNVLRKERGVLPMPFHTEAPRLREGQVLRAGYGGGLFHPATGYSFPLAARFAEALANVDVARDLDRSTLTPVEDALLEHARQLPFLSFVTRLMFSCFEPSERFRALEHFYRLPNDLIARFYAAKLTPLDRARIFMGAPPRGLSVGRALGLSREVHS